MASVKQLNMLCAKARAAGIDFDRDKNKELSNEEIDALVAKFDANGGKQEKTVKSENVDAIKEINHARFGLACKLVIQQGGMKWVLSEPKDYIAQVKQLYELLNQAEAAVSASSSSSPSMEEIQEEENRQMAREVRVESEAGQED